MRRRPRPDTPRLVVLAVLLSYAAWALVLPWMLTDPPSTPLAVAYAVGLLALGLALLVMLHAAVAPDAQAGTRRRAVALVLVASLVLWAPSYAWADAGSDPWAWLAGFALGLAPLAVPWRTAVAVGVVLTGAAALGAALWPGSVPRALLVTVGCAATVWAMCQVLVWLLRLLRTAETGREAETALSVASERLRVSRELHDVLGHRLGIIALKAELASGLAAHDPARARAETDEIRALAATTLAEARRAVVGDTVTDLAGQVASAELVLRSAGIEARLDVADAPPALPGDASRLLAAVVREAVTNLLRHSDARTVSLHVARTPSATTLVIVNDGARPAAPRDAAGGTGLPGLAARCAAAGGRLEWSPLDGDRFEVRAELAHTAGGAG